MDLKLRNNQRKELKDGIKKAQNILARSFDGGHICMENAEAAVEAAESEKMWKSRS